MTIFTELAQPFVPADVSWKPGRTSGNKCLALAYADLRCYLDRLDAICGADWSVRYTPWGDDRVICELTIGGITRCSTGEMDAQDEKNGMGGTVAEAQAFKRACAMFGLGRGLYKLPSTWVEFDSQRKRITDVGQQQLMEQYQAWYIRAISAKGQAEELDDADANSLDNAPEAISQAQMTRLHTLGVDFYGSKAEWDARRSELCKAVSSGATTRSEELTCRQAQLLIDGLAKRLRERKVALVTT